MRQKTKNHQNQGSIDKKFDFFPQSLSHIPRWVHFVQKTRAKNSHAWAPLKYMFSVWLQTEDASPRVRLPLPLLHPEQQLRRGDRLHLVLTATARHTI